jgi:hypothetical protein
MVTNSNTTMAFITNRQRKEKKEAIRQAGVIMSTDGCIILRKVAKSLAPFPISTDSSLFSSSRRLFRTHSSNVCTHGCNCHICTISNLLTQNPTCCLISKTNYIRIICEVHRTLIWPIKVVASTCSHCQSSFTASSRIASNLKGLKCDLIRIVTVPTHFS